MHSALATVRDYFGVPGTKTSVSRLDARARHEALRRDISHHLRHIHAHIYNSVADWTVCAAFVLNVLFVLSVRGMLITVL